MGARIHISGTRATEWDSRQRRVGNQLWQSRPPAVQSLYQCVGSRVGQGGREPREAFRRRLRLHGDGFAGPGCMGSQWKRLTRGTRPSPKLWMDGYLAAGAMKRSVPRAAEALLHSPDHTESQRPIGSGFRCILRLAGRRSLGGAARCLTSTRSIGRSRNQHCCRRWRER